MFLTLLKCKILLLAVVFSTPVFSQIYGTTESTNDPPEKCEKAPTMCVGGGQCPGGCSYGEPEPVCKDLTIDIVKTKNEVNMLTLKLQAAKMNQQERKKELADLISKSADLYRKQEDLRKTYVRECYQRDLSGGCTPGTVAGYNVGPGGIITTGPGGPHYSVPPSCSGPGYTSGFCLTPDGNERDVEVGWYVREIWKDTIPCGSLIFEVEKLVQTAIEPGDKTVEANIVNIGIEATRALRPFEIRVGGVTCVLRPTASDSENGLGCNVQDSCIKTVKETCAKYVADKFKEKVFDPTWVISKSAACLKFNPVSIGVKHAWTIGALIYDINSCPAPNTYVPRADFCQRLKNNGIKASLDKMQELELYIRTEETNAMLAARDAASELSMAKAKLSDLERQRNECLKNKYFDRLKEKVERSCETCK